MAENNRKTVKHIKVRKKTVRPVEAHIRQVENIPAYPKKITNTRTDLSDGCYMVTYYYRKGPYGELIAEDIDNATYFERAVYDQLGNLLGTTVGELNQKICW